MTVCAFDETYPELYIVVSIIVPIKDAFIFTGSHNDARMCISIAISAARQGMY